ncbi:MAG: hypothetical protein L6R41_003381, partial [Letrouitia leprolyta]
NLSVHATVPAVFGGAPFTPGFSEVVELVLHVSVFEDTLCPCRMENKIRSYAAPPVTFFRTVVAPGSSGYLKV